MTTNNEQTQAALAAAPGARAVPMAIIGALNDAHGSNDWQGDATPPELLANAVAAIAALAAPQPAAQPGETRPVGESIMDAFAARFGLDAGWQGIQGSWFTEGYMARHREWLAAQPSGRAQHEDDARDAKLLRELGEIIHNMVVAQQAAWIEWRHGRGAEAGMVWIQNGLVGPGHIPDEDEPYGKEAQAWFDANQAKPFPKCHCGRPSNTLWMGQGFCSPEHYKAARAQQDGGAQHG